MTGVCKYLKKRCLALIFILIAQYLLIPIIHAQNRDLRFEHITVEDGLSQSWVHCIYQDSYGFIWIGTEDGLNLYDGQQMMIYKHNLRDKKSISSNTISAIYEDSRGILWIGTTNGLNLYDRINDCFDLIEEINTWSVLSIAEDKDHNLWIGTVYTLYRYNPATKSLKRFEASAGDQDNKISNNYINKILIDSDNNIWVATNDGLNLFNPADESFTKYFYDPLNPASISSNHINTLLEDSEKRIWCGNDNGLNWFKNAKEKPSEGIFARYSYNKKDLQSIASGEVLALIEDRENNMWIGIENGGIDILDLKSFNGVDAQFVHHTHDPRYSYSLNNNSVQTIFQDKQDIIWAGTFGNGINKYSKADANFKHYFNEAKDENSLSDNHVNVFLEDGQFVWIGTEGGLNRFNKADGTFKRYVNQPGNPSSLSSNAVWAIFKDSRGDLWVGTWAGGLNKFDYRTETFVHYINNPEDSTSLGSNNVFSIYEDKDFNLWIGTMGNGINKFNPKNGKFERYNIANTDINSDYVEAIVGNPDGTMWLANVTSLELFDPVTFSFEHFMHTSDTNSISGNKIFSVFRDSKNRVWIGTDAGLNLFDEKNKSFIQFFTEEGLPDNSIKSIVEDQRGDIWIGTNKGLSKFVTASLGEKPKFINYNAKGGIQGYEFERRSAMRDQKGNLYFGGTNGFNIFHPDSLSNNSFIPSIVFTEFLLFNQKVKAGIPGSPLKMHIGLTKVLKLTYKQSVFGFKFRALNYRYPEYNQYAYRMENFNSDWIRTGNQGEATFTNLDPGSYTFHVIGSNDDELWNETGASIEIIILPPWWQTWWFRILMVIVAVLFLFLIYLSRVKELRRQKLQLEKKVIERTREIEEKNIILQKQTNELNETNILLEERQEYIEEQAEELKAQADELLEANKNLLTLNATKDKFFSIIAHDLKNPFTSILGFCEVLFTRYEVYDDSKRKHLIGIINSSAQNIYKLLENLLQWARSQTGTIKYNPEVFEIDELVMNNIILMENQMKAKNILTEKVVPEGIAVFADKNMINTVMRNLISNAVKFSEGGKILVVVRKDETSATIMVRDSGIGMSKEDAGMLFEIGASKSTEGTRGEPGTGLGLIICKEFVLKNNGKIWVESEPGKGSSFYFTVPLDSHN